MASCISPGHRSSNPRHGPGKEKSNEGPGCGSNTSGVVSFLSWSPLAILVKGFDQVVTFCLSFLFNGWNIGEGVTFVSMCTRQSK